MWVLSQTLHIMIEYSVHNDSNNCPGPDMDKAYNDNDKCLLNISAYSDSVKYSL